MGNAKVATFTEITPAKDAAFANQANLLPAHLGLDVNGGGVVEYDVWASIYNPGKMALLVGRKKVKALETWMPKKTHGVERLRHRKVRVVRDYDRLTAAKRRNSIRT